MDANSFLTGATDQKPKFAEWLLAVGRFLAGIAIVWLAAKTTITKYPGLGAWIGMFGLVLILHFGLFHLLALGWQSTGLFIANLVFTAGVSQTKVQPWRSEPERNNCEKY